MIGVGSMKVEQESILRLAHCLVLKIGMISFEGSLLNFSAEDISNHAPI